MCYVYILQSEKNGTYYIGSTNDLKRRMNEHHIGHVPSTRYLRPLVLKYFKEIKSLAEARKVEFRLKKFKSRKIIEQIIEEQEIRFLRN